MGNLMSRKKRVNKKVSKKKRLSKKKSPKQSRSNLFKSGRTPKLVMIAENPDIIKRTNLVKKCNVCNSGNAELYYCKQCIREGKKNPFRCTGCIAKNYGNPYTHECTIHKQHLLHLIK